MDDSLADLISEANRIHQEAETLRMDVTDSTIALGEALLELRDKVGMRSWKRYVNKNHPFNYRAANGYIEVAKQYRSGKAKEDLVPVEALTQRFLPHLP